MLVVLPRICELDRRNVRAGDVLGAHSNYRGETGSAPKVLFIFFFASLA